MADTNIVEFPTQNYAGRPDLLLADMLKAARDGALSEVIVIGIKPYGDLDTASTMGDADTNWHIDQFKRLLITP